MNARGEGGRLKGVRQIVYLDHNVLDAMIKSRVPCVRALFLSRRMYIPVFSTENLNEIERSKGCEHIFLNLLREIGAKYLRPHVTPDFCYTGEASIEEADPFEEFDAYKVNKLATPPMGYGLGGMLQKFYGGLQGQGFDQILSKGANELDNLLDSALEGLGDEDIPGIDRSALIRHIEQTKASYRGLPKNSPELLRESIPPLL